MEGAVYLLCAATALACGVLLLRGYRQSRSRLLLWCGLFFLMMAAENVILFADLVLFPETDMSAATTTVGLAGALVLLYGLIWEVK
ncbi:MAG TPA: DUF5985 family protein [Gemmataceae bacterium]|jgi:hypothetical protein